MQNEMRDDKAHGYNSNSNSMFKFFFADKDLMYDTIGVKIYEAIFMVDFVYMIAMVQTHPYYKGLFLDRKWIIIRCVHLSQTHFPLYDEGRT